MSENIENKSVGWESFNKRGQNEELVYVPIERANRSKQEIYIESQIDRKTINEYAAYAAANTKKPRATREETIDVTKERQVNFGPFGMFSKTEKYTEKAKKYIKEDFWVLDTKTFFKSETEQDKSICEESEQYHCCLHKDGHLFHRTNKERVYVDSKDWSCYVTNEIPANRDLTDSDIINLDYEVKYAYISEPRLKINNFCNPSNNLLHAKKGDGLLALIGNLID